MSDGHESHPVGNGLALTGEQESVAMKTNRRQPVQRLVRLRRTQRTGLCQTVRPTANDLRKELT